MQFSSTDEALKKHKLVPFIIFRSVHPWNTLLQYAQYLQTGAVCMGSNNTKPIPCLVFATNSKGNNGWLVPGYKILEKQTNKLKFIIQKNGAAFSNVLEERTNAW